MQTAPLYTDVAKAPDGGGAYWITTADGVRIRIGVWDKGANGTVFLLTGRTEYIEKYGQTAGDLQLRGFATLTQDWRGQGLADRLLDDPAKGHVMHFADYQHDVQAMFKAADELSLPKPYYLLAHSMGGCIALRSLINGIDVKAAAFSAPMWGIAMSGAVKPIARGLSWSFSSVGLGHKYAPGTDADNYVVTAPFADNQLTTDPEMFAYMKHQAKTYPQLPLGGPSMHWLFEALTETRDLATLPAPGIAAAAFLGSNERIVDCNTVIKRMQSWDNGRLEVFPGAEHEVLMEVPKVRNKVLDCSVELFLQHR